MSQFPRFGYGGFVSFPQTSWFISLKEILGYYDGVIFHRSALPKKFDLSIPYNPPAGLYPDFLYRQVIKQAQVQVESPSMAVRRPLCVPHHHHQVAINLTLKAYIIRTI
jgi:hypothetical protein